MKQIISPVHRLTLIKKTRRRVRFAAWLKGAMLLAMLPQSVSAIVLGAGYTKLGSWNPSVTTTQNGSNFRGSGGGKGLSKFYDNRGLRQHDKRNIRKL